MPACQLQSPKGKGNVERERERERTPTQRCQAFKKRRSKESPIAAVGIFIECQKKEEDDISKKYIAVIMQESIMEGNGFGNRQID